MKRALKMLGWGLAVVVVLALGAYVWVYRTAMGYYETQWTAHDASFPIPFPLTDREKADLAAERIAAGASTDEPLAGVDLEAVARDRAIERGNHLVHSRVGCHECHGEDFGGMVVLSGVLLGAIVAPNLTTGQGSVTKGFTSSDWDHAVRHGLRHNGRSSAMPSNEFVNLTDRELSDVVSYIRSRPAVDRTMPPVKLGPLLAVALVSDRETYLSAFKIDHQRAHLAEPPAEEPTAELGRHIAQVCSTCHGPNFSGGMLAGDPNMPEVANLTPDETGLKGWTEADFFRAIREGRRKDGTSLSDEMPWRAYALMSDTELEAVWAYLQTLPPRAKGNH